MLLIIKSVFEANGKCYRIGGDEFSVVIKKEGCGKIAGELTRKLEEEIRQHNIKNPEDTVNIAWGYEEKTTDDKRSYNEIIYSADEKMYENKRYKKGLTKMDSH